MGGVEDLAALRAEMDRLDEELVSLLSQRVDIARRIGELKASQGVEVWDAGRVDEMMTLRRAWAADVGLDEGFVLELFERIVDFCARIQKNRSEDSLK